MNYEIGTTLVYGATGAQGGAVLQKLIEDGQPALGLARDEGEAKWVREVGAEAVIGNFEDAESLKRASQRASKVFLVLPLGLGSEKIHLYVKNAVNAAENAGVELLVLNTSTRIPEEHTGLDAYEDKREIETYIHNSGVPFVSLRPTFYMGNFLGPWTKPAILNDAVVAYPIPVEVKASWISWEDMAAFAVAALRRPELAGRTFDIGGPEVLDGEGIAKRFTNALGKPVSYYPIPVAEFEKGLSEALGSETGSAVAGLYQWMEGREDTELFTTDVEVLKKDLPVEPIPLSSWIRMHEWT